MVITVKVVSIIISLPILLVIGISINCNFEEDPLNNEEKHILNVDHTIFKIISLCQFAATSQLFLHNVTFETVALTMEERHMWTSTCSDVKNVSVYGEPDTIQNIRVIMLSNNNITHFESDYFCNFSDLLILNLASNLLKDVTKLGFSLDCTAKLCCGCRLKILTLSNNQLAVVKNNSFCRLQQLVILRLDNCLIAQIEANAFTHLTILKVLDLSANNIAFINTETFRNNKNLRTLKLRGNKLTSTSLWSLKPLTQLRFLDVSGNNIENLSNLKPVFDVMSELKALHFKNNLLSSLDDEFMQLSQLKVLDLSFNHLANTSDRSFANLKSLICLILDHNRLKVAPSIKNLFLLQSLEVTNNFLTSLKKTDFINVTDLISVGFDANNISAIESGTFDDIALLKRLSLRENNLTNIHRVFHRSNIKKIYLNDNQLTKLSFADFSSSLEMLSAQNNLIVSLDWADFEKTFVYVSGESWSLKRIKLNENQLSTLENFFIPPSVEKFEAKNNQIENITYHLQYQQWLDSSATQLTKMDLQNNKFLVIPRSAVFMPSTVRKVSPKYFLKGNLLQCSCENAWIKNSISNLSVKIFTVSDISELDCAQLPKSMKNFQIKNLLQLNFSQLFCKSSSENENRCNYNYAVGFRPVSSSINCKYRCPLNCSCYSTLDFASVEVDCSTAGLKSVPKAIEDKNNLQKSEFVVWLDGNDFNFINSTDLDSFGDAIRLYLHQSNVIAIESNAFDALTFVQVLHLQNNRIASLPAGLFDKLYQIQELYLFSNALKIMPNDIFNPLSSLQVLQLHNNLLSNFTVWTLDKLKKLTKVTLHQNPWSCKCQFVDHFLFYLQNHSAIIQNEDEIACKELKENNSEIPLMTFNSTRCYGAGPTVSFSKAEILAPTLVLLVCVTVTASLLFVFRHELQVIIYSRYGVRVFNGGNENNEDKVYDAFISYNSDDVNFLIKNLLPSLEQIDRPYRLCIHERDFAPGAFITDSILEAVEVSARTIILLTENYVRSEWCRFEFKTAHVQMLQDRCPRVLVIVVGDVPTDVDPEMKLYLKTNTYLKWGEKLFWKKLYFAMPDRRVAGSLMSLLPMPETELSTDASTANLNCTE